MIPEDFKDMVASGFPLAALSTHSILYFKGIRNLMTVPPY